MNTHQHNPDPRPDPLTGLPQLSDQVDNARSNALKPINKKLVGLNARDMLNKHYPRKEYLLRPWLQRQSLCMLFAYRGIGKTYVALSIALAVATGTPYLKWSAPTRKRVLFLDGEMSGYDLRDRIDKLVKQHEDFNEVNLDLSNLTIVTPDEQDVPLNISTPEGQERLSEMAQDHDLIIVDNIATLTTSGIDNEGDAWTAIQNWALYQRRHGRSVLFIHHANKKGGQRGTSAREDVLDTVIGLKRPKDYQADQGARFEVEFTKSRSFSGEDAETFEAALSVVNGRAIWDFVDNQGMFRKQVFHLFDQGLSQRKIAIELNTSKSSVQRILQENSGISFLE